MSKGFIQGSGKSVLYRYNSSDALQETITMPPVRDDGRSYIKQWFDPYPENKLLEHELLSGAVGKDSPLGYRWRCQVKYESILATELKSILQCILTAYYTSGNYLKLKPRDDQNTIYKIVYKGIFPLESSNAWRHNILLDFAGIDLVAASLTLAIPA